MLKQLLFISFIELNNLTNRLLRKFRFDFNKALKGLQKLKQFCSIFKF